MKYTTILLIFTVFINANINSQDDKAAKKYKKVARAEHLKDLKNGKVKKLLFIEFYGVFSTVKRTSPKKLNSLFKPEDFIFDRSENITADFYENITNEMYELVKKLFIENGIDILEKDKVIKNPEYVALDLKAEKDLIRYIGDEGIEILLFTGKHNVRTATDLGMYSETARLSETFKMMNLLPRIAKENGCDGVIAVKFEFDLIKKHQIGLKYLNIDISYGLDIAGKGEKKTYYFNEPFARIFSMKKEIYVGADLEINDRNVENYHKSLIDLTKYVIDTYSYLFKIY
jgi:hypothetical protein